jgi:hypothetical protein
MYSFYVWSKQIENMKKPQTDETIKGFLVPSLREPCIPNSSNSSNNINILNIPSSYEIGNCDPSLICSTDLFTNKDGNSGVCLSRIGGVCNSLLDCDTSFIDAAKTIKIDVCLDGICSITGDYLNRLCYTNNDCMSSSVKAQYDIDNDDFNLDFKCSDLGRCKYNYNKGPCFTDTDCFSTEDNDSYCGYDELTKKNVCKLYGIEGENNVECGNGLYYNTDQKMCQIYGKNKGDLGAVCDISIKSCNSSKIYDDGINLPYTINADCLYDDNITKKIDSSLNQAVTSLSNKIGVCSYPVKNLYEKCDFLENNCKKPYYCENFGSENFCNKSLSTMYCGIEGLCPPGFDCVDGICKTNDNLYPCVVNDFCSSGVCGTAEGGTNLYKIDDNGNPIFINSLNSLNNIDINDENSCVFDNASEELNTSIASIQYQTADKFVLVFYNYDVSEGEGYTLITTISFENVGNDFTFSINYTVNNEVLYNYSETADTVHMTKIGNFSIRKVYTELDNNQNLFSIVLLESISPFPYPIPVRIDIDFIVGIYNGDTDEETSTIANINRLRATLFDIFGAMFLDNFAYSLSVLDTFDKNRILSDFTSLYSGLSLSEKNTLIDGTTKVSYISKLFDPFFKLSDTNYIVKTSYSYTKTNNNENCFLTCFYSIFQKTNNIPDFNFYIIFMGSDRFVSIKDILAFDSLPGPGFADFNYETISYDAFKNILPLLASNPSGSLSRAVYKCTPYNIYEIDDINYLNDTDQTKKYYTPYTDYIYKITTSPIYNKKYIDLIYNDDGKLTTPTVIPKNHYDHIFFLTLPNKIENTDISQMIIYQKVFTSEVRNGNDIYFFQLKGYENVYVNTIYYDPSYTNRFGNRKFLASLDINGKKSFMLLYSENNENTFFKNKTFNFIINDILPNNPNVSSFNISNNTYYFISKSCNPNNI